MQYATRLVLLALAFAVLSSSSAHASPACDSFECATETPVQLEAPAIPTPRAVQCEASYPERLADAQQAITAQSLYMASWSRVMPWFDQHCRFLTELERAIRKVDDPAAFVCNTSKGRPAGLTSEFVAEHSQPADVVIFQERVWDNDRCAPHDTAAGRPSLVLREPGPAQKLAIVCYGDERPSCTKAREALALLASRGPST